MHRMSTCVAAWCSAAGVLVVGVSLAVCSRESEHMKHKSSLSGHVGSGFLSAVVASGVSVMKPGPCPFRHFSKEHV